MHAHKHFTSDYVSHSLILHLQVLCNATRGVNFGRKATRRSGCENCNEVPLSQNMLGTLPLSLIYAFTECYASQNLAHSPIMYFILLSLSSVTMLLPSLCWALQLLRDIPADVGFLCDKAVVLGVTMEETHCIMWNTQLHDRPKKSLTWILIQPVQYTSRSHRIPPNFEFIYVIISIINCLPYCRTAPLYVALLGVT